MKRALLVRVDGTTEVVDLDAGDPATLIRGEIGCQWFEVVRVTSELYLWVDEEGRLAGKPPNLAACWLAVPGEQLGQIWCPRGPPCGRIPQARRAQRG